MQQADRATRQQGCLQQMRRGWRLRTATLERTHVSETPRVRSQSERVITCSPAAGACSNRFLIFVAAGHFARICALLPLPPRLECGSQFCDAEAGGRGGAAIGIGRRCKVLGAGGDGGWGGGGCSF